MIREWKAIEYDGIKSLVAMDPWVPEKFYWQGRSSWCIKTIKYSEIKSYGRIDEDEEGEIEKITLDFHKTVGEEDLRVGLARSGGWISPEGVFYHCENWEHDSLAERLTAIYHDCLIGTVLLEQENWIRVSSTGNLQFDDVDVLTVRQKNFLLDLLLSVPKNDVYYKNLEYWIKLILARE